MVRLSTKYDYDIKKETYYVTGDKGYTKSTSVLLKEVSINTSRIEYAVKTFTVQVLGSVGDSNIVIYDNGVPVNVTVSNNIVSMINWNANSSGEITFSMMLNYDVEHNIQARYNGNNHCLKSKSQLISLTEPTPNKYLASISRTDATVQFDGSNVSLGFKFKTNSSFVNNMTKTLKVYCDDVLKSELNLTLQRGQLECTGTASFRVSSLGLNDILVVFEGDEYNNRAELSFNISTGYKITVQKPTYAFVNTELTLPVSVTDFFGNPIINKWVNATVYKTNSTIETTSRVYTDDKGQTDIIISVSLMNNISLSNLICDVNCNNVISERVECPLIHVNAINTDIDSLIAVNNMRSIINGQLVSNNINTPVRVDISNGQREYVYTDNSGSFNVDYIGEGKGDFNLILTADNKTKTITVEDLLGYWVGNGNNNKLNYNPHTASIRELTTGLKISPSGSNGGLWINDENLLGKDFTIDFDIVELTNNPWLFVGYHQDSYFVFNNGSYSILTNNTHVTIRCENNQIIAYNGNNVISQAVYDNDYYPCLVIGRNSGSGYSIRINNVKVKVI